MSKDKSGFTPQERHKIIVDYLQEIGKPTKVFHLRWKPGDLLNGQVLETTPMFWYMKYQWGRQEIETMFYKARCVIGPSFDQALQQTFGGDPGPRWRGAIPEKKKSKWRERQAEKTQGWQAEQAEKLKQKEEEERQRKIAEQKRKAEEERLRKEEEKKLASKGKDIWNAVSDFGADKSIDYKTFSENLKDRGINVSPLLAKQLFDQLAGPGGKLTKQQMDELIKKLDQITDSANITIDMLGDKLGCMTIMKRVLLAAGAGEPFNVDDFVFAQKFSYNIDTIQFMNKLTDRDVPWDDRVRAMEQLGANLGTNPLFNNVLARGNIPELLCGWATQVMDNKPEVQKTAIETLPNVFHNALEFGDKDIAVGHLEEILDNLFKVLDDPKVSRNHPAAMDAIDKLVDDVIKTGDPESVLFVAGLLAEKTDIENTTSPEGRKFALAQLQKIMFGKDSPYSKFDDEKKKPPVVAHKNLPPKGTVNREWLDIGTNNQKGPSPAMMTKTDDPQQYNDSEDSRQKGRYVPDNQLRDEKKYDPETGSDEESFEYKPTDPADPYAHLTSNPSTSKVNEPVDFDASKSHDCDHEPCVKFVFDFGDGTPNVTSDKPIVPHPYAHPGVYPVSVVVTDKYGKTGKAMCTQRVIDPKEPKKIGPPYAQLTSDPTESRVGQIVYFDASKSHDFKNEPVEHYVFDFGDGSKPLHSKVPKVTHPYQKRGAYPVTCEVTDKYGQKAKAGLQQRVIDPEMQDPGLPYAHLSSEPTEAKTKEPVTFDASKSCDCNGDPVKKYVFDFGDGTKPVTSFKPIVTHPYEKGGTYPVKVTVTDKYGKKASAELSQRVKAPFNKTERGPPYAAVKSTPPEADIDEPVTFDASASHDYLNEPCELYVWDFGDGSPKKTSTTPIVQHPYKEAGTYPVTVKVTDKYGQTAPAKCNQRVRGPPEYVTKDTAEKIEDPYVTVESTPTKAKVNEPVTFDASKSHDMDNDPLKTYVWDFGDGTPKVTTKGPIVKHPYKEAGTYPVKVVGIDKYDRKGDAKLNQLVVDPKNPNAPLPPYAHVVSDPSIAEVEQPVKFDASKSHDQFDKPCVQFVWDFGDGSPKVTTPGPYTTHPYKAPGTYPVKVVVTDKNGLSAQAGLNQKVIQKGPSEEDPYAAVSSTPPEAEPKEPVRFDASKSHDMDGDPCKTFKWDFGDGSPPVTTTTPIINHPYDKPGTYPVKVTVTDKNGRQGDASLQQKVIDPKNPTKIGPPYAALKSTPPEAAINQPVLFDASDSHDFEKKPCVKFVWDFGDGSPKKTTKEPTVEHPYKKAGVYPVTVTVTDKHNQTGKASVNQRVRAPKKEDPYAALNSTPPEAAPKEPVTFDASRSVDMDGDPCKTFVFDFGDGSPPKTSTDPVVKHAYTEPGSYPVTVTVTDKHGNRGNAALTQKVTDSLPPFNISSQDPTKDPYVTVSSTPSQAKVNEPVTFDASPSKDMDDEPLKKFIWDFGDGTPPVTTTTPVVEHPYKKPGTYPVKVIGVDKYGRKGDATLNQQVIDPKNPKDPLPPYAAVTSDPAPSKVDEPVKFDASKSHDYQKKPCVTFLWDFGDDSPRVTTKEPYTTHPYKAPGKYPVKVTVTDKLGQTADAGLTQKVVDPMEFYNIPSDDPTKDPTVEVSSTPTNAKVNEPVTFDASPSKDMDGEPLKKFIWDFGDGTPPVETKEPIVQHPYSQPGSYPVKVTGVDKYGRKGDAKLTQRVVDPKNPTKTLPPYAAVTSNPSPSKVNQPVKFDASKSHDGEKKPCVKFVWDFGDDSPKVTTKEPYTTHPYKKTGKYPVTVEVTDKLGQTADAGLTQKVVDTMPSYNIPSDDPTKDPYVTVSSTPSQAKVNEPVTFDASPSKDMDGEPLKKFIWDFGDGTPPVETSTPVVQHPYKKPGTYPVKVTGVDKYGRKGDAKLNQQVIDPKNPKKKLPPYAAVKSNPSPSMVDEPVDFDASKSHDFEKKPCVNFVWDFGDGSPKVTTKEPYTKHPYKAPGKYPVKVTVTDKYGQKADAGLTQKVQEPMEFFNIPSDDPTKDPYVTVSSDPTNAKVNEPVTFDATPSTDMDGDPIKKFIWDFGDGTDPVTTTEPVVEHPYKRPGSYPVKVIGVDKYGRTGDAALSQRVVDPKNPKEKLPPYAAITSDPPTSNVDEPVKFDASKSHDGDKKPCVSFLWDFGDGSPRVTTTEPYTTHPYEEMGKYPVKVTVTDKLGQTAQAGLTQKVIDPMTSYSTPSTQPIDDPYVAVSSTPPVAKPKEPVTFDASKSHDMDGDPCKNYVWDFGDGSPPVTTKEPVVKHAYSEPGSYPVKVTATDKYDKTGEANLTQKVTDPKNPTVGPPYAHVTSDPPEASVMEPVNFDASKSMDADKKPCVKFVWDFGDKSPKKVTTEPKTTHPYAHPGVFPVTVSVTDKHGQTAEAGLNQRVKDDGEEKSPMKGKRYPINRRRDETKEDPQDGRGSDYMEPPYAALTTTPPESVVNQPVTCDASKSVDYEGNPCVKFVWDFGDGSPLKTTKEPTTDHPFKKPGTYPVSVVVTDKDGLTGRAQCNQRVREPEIEDPFAHVTSDPQYAKPSEPVKFDASKSHDMDGDPCKTFVWDFGDGSPLEKTTEPTTSHAYDEPGSYPVTVTVTDKYGKKGNANLTQQIVDPTDPDKIYPPVADLESHPHESVPKQPVTFDASKSRDFKGEPCKKFVWDFGDGSPKKTTKEPVTTHPYQKPGSYPVTVEVTDKYDQTATAGVNQRVREPGPEDPYVQLNNEPPISKPKEPVTFDASKSVDMDGDPCKNYTFDFGDGSPVVHTPKPIVKHAYDEPGSYPVTVTATDKYGRKGNAAVTQRVIDPKNPKKKGPPVAHVTSDPPDAKVKQPVTFDASKSHDMDKKPCVKFVWDFGDGSPKKTTKEPVTKHPYKKPGVYPVTVTVTDKYNQSADAFLNQRVSDPGVTDSDPTKGPRAPKNRNYGGRPGQGGTTNNPPSGTFGKKGGNKKPGNEPPFDDYKNEPTDSAPGMAPEEIGDEFRNIVHDATSNAILDPNPKNNRDGKKLADVMKQLNPAFIDDLDPEAKKQYGKFNKKPLKPMRPPPKALPRKPLPKRGVQRLHHVETEVHVDVGKPIMPDI